MEKGKAKRILGRVVGIGAALAMGAAAGMLTVRAIEGALPEDASAPTMLLFYGVGLVALYATLVAHIALHEGGHCIAGLLTGYRFVSYRLFGLMWVRREDERIHFARFSLAGTGGQCLMEPPDPDPVEGTFPVLAYNLGGPLANIACAILALAAAFACAGNPALQALCWLNVVVGVAYGLVNGLPLRTSLLNNDGMNALELRRDAAARRSFWTETKMNAGLARGVRLKDMPREWFRLPDNAEMGNGLVASEAAMYENLLMDERRFGEVDELVAHLAAEPGALPPIYLQAMQADRMFCLLVQGKRDEAAALASKELRKQLKALQSMPSVLRTQYALARLLDCDEKAAARLRAQFERVTRSYPYPAEAQAERELVGLADSLCEQS